MTGILGKFYVEHNVHGARVMARSLQLTSDCTEDGEIDTAIQMLKDDLDACAKEMKRLVKVNRASLFEGWPTDAQRSASVESGRYRGPTTTWLFSRRPMPRTNGREDSPGAISPIRKPFSARYLAIC